MKRLKKLKYLAIFIISIIVLIFIVELSIQNKLVSQIIHSVKNEESIKVSEISIDNMFCEDYKRDKKELQELNKINGRRMNLANCNISKIDSFEKFPDICYIFLFNNDITIIENIETIKSEEFNEYGELWIDESIEYITQESYNFLKSNPGIEVFFVPEGSSAGSGYLGSDKTIDDLEII